MRRIAPHRLERTSTFLNIFPGEFSPNRDALCCRKVLANRYFRPSALDVVKANRVGFVGRKIPSFP
jgi:hypothetical protein